MGCRDSSRGLSRDNFWRIMPAVATAHQVVVAFLNRKPFWFSISGLL